MRNGKEIPADCLFLTTSDPDGICLINEVNLDGANAIKQRKAVNLEHILRLASHLFVPPSAII
jgi:magnesium-transporting ATPase (P-type)